MKITEKKQVNDARNIAKALITVSNNRNIPIDQLKLQKLLYFAQALSLVRNNRPLFSNHIYAWDHGPVVKPVWEIYNGYESRNIPPEETINLETLNLSKKEIKVIEDITETMKRYTGIQLREITHKHGPWKETYQNGKNKTISNKTIREYYKNILS